MNKVKILALMATVVLLALLPVGLYALQPEAPHQFFGTAWLADGSVAPDGTVVDAWIDGEEVATTTVDSSLGEARILPPGGSPRGWGDFFRQECDLQRGWCGDS